MDEAKLARKLQKGDRFALNRAIAAYTPYLSTVVWRAMGSGTPSQDVEEVVSDVFFALWSHRESLCPEKGVKSWLAAVARNKAVDRLRGTPPPPQPLDRSEDVSGESPEEELERRLFAVRLRKAVEDLPPPDDQLVLRFYYEEEKLKDIAASLGLTVPAAKTRLHRSRRKLKDILTKGGSANGTDG